jgi:hypothetical protein
VQLIVAPDATVESDDDDIDADAGTDWNQEEDEADDEDEAEDQDEAGAVVVEAEDQDEAEAEETPSSKAPATTAATTPAITAATTPAKSTAPATTAATTPAITAATTPAKSTAPATTPPSKAPATTPPSKAPASTRSVNFQLLTASHSKMISNVAKGINLGAWLDKPKIPNGVFSTPTVVFLSLNADASRRSNSTGKFTDFVTRQALFVKLTETLTAKTASSAVFAYMCHDHRQLLSSTLMYR